jgi:hypothetical protein
MHRVPVRKTGYVHTMASRRTAALAVLALLSSASAASAAQEEVQPRAGVLLSGSIQFPRAQEMSIQTNPGNGTRLTAYVGFDGRCRGGGLAEVWAANIPARPALRVRNGRFSGTLTGVARKLGGVEGRTGNFRWRVTGRFVESDVATATVAGQGEVRLRGRVVSRCKIAEPASVRLTIR